MVEVQSPFLFPMLYLSVAGYVEFVEGPKHETP